MAAVAGHRRFLPRGATTVWLYAALAGALVAALIAGVLVVTDGRASADQPPVDLGAAEHTAVLAAGTVISANATLITGDVDVSPGTAVTGFPPGVIEGDVHAGDAEAAQVMADATAAYDDISARGPAVTVPAELGGTRRTPGVYDSADGTFRIDGTLVIDAGGNPDAVFVFRAATLTTARVSNIVLTGGAQADNVFWQATEGAVLGTYSTFRGTVLARGSIKVTEGAVIDGRTLLLDNTVTIEGTTEADNGVDRANELDAIVPPPTRVTLPFDPATTTQLTSSPNPSQAKFPVTFTARVRPRSGTLAPAGRVLFKDDGVVIGSGMQTGADTPATFTTSALSVGEHHITAVYLGGLTAQAEAWVRFAPSTSNEVVQVVNAR
ncbi:ice-binding family protein [Microbispora sp. H10885]|uniref:ice-binding family protein n=1 Tax=Microbispora sp. H10885 TaxID=2729110 RepID=UPI00160091B6|nr:ice-binding family protein [Microbispora sp. H10885]